MMPRNLTTLALALVLTGAGGWLWTLISDRNQLRIDLSAARITIATAKLAQEQAEQAARVHRAHLARAADQARQFDVIRNDLQLLEGRDAPLSPLLSATADRLFGAK